MQFYFTHVFACLFISLACNSLQALADTFDAPEIPKPLKSKNLKNWMKDVAPSDAERVKCEQAFDAYVDQWQLLRDQVIRPAQAKYDAALGAQDEVEEAIEVR